MRTSVTSNLSSADLRSTFLRRANLSGAKLFLNEFAGIDLSEAIGLDLVIHNGPSQISIDTIYRSEGRIPEVFLRGCGVPENFITFMHSLTGKAFDFYSCFISHSSKDTALL